MVRVRPRASCAALTWLEFIGRPAVPLTGTVEGAVGTAEAEAAREALFSAVLADPAWLSDLAAAVARSLPEGLLNQLGV